MNINRNVYIYIYTYICNLWKILSKESYQAITINDNNLKNIITLYAKIQTIYITIYNFCGKIMKSQIWQP